MLWARGVWGFNRGRAHMEADSCMLDGTCPVLCRVKRSLLLVLKSGIGICGRVFWTTCSENHDISPSGYAVPNTSRLMWVSP